MRTALIGVFAAAVCALGAPASAAASYATSQLGYDDDNYQTNSVRIVCSTNSVPPCYNQNGASNFSQCVNTPNTFTHDYGWWWQGGVFIEEFTTSGCSGNFFASKTFTVTTGTANGWFCYNYPTQGPWEC